MDVRTIKDKVISLYFEGNGLDQITEEFLSEDLICSIMRSYTCNLRSIKSFNDIDSEKMSEKQKEFIKTIINHEKARRLYRQKISEATALKQEHIKNMKEITKPFREPIRELESMAMGLIQSELLDIFVNGATPESLGEFIEDVEEFAIEKHIKVKTCYDNVVRHSEKVFKAMMCKGQRLMSESRATSGAKAANRSSGRHRWT